MTPLEEQVEKLARAWDKDAEQIGGIRGDYAAGVSSTFQSAATQLRALLPLEVTDGKARITDEMELAGAKALWRVFKGDRNWDHATPIMQDYYREQSRDCLSAALTQPQTEKKCACVGPENALKPDEWHSPTCGGGAATAAGVADALTLTPGEARNLVDAAMGDEHDPQLLDSTVKRIGDEADRQLAEPGPYAKAFRERVCPVPEFPGIKNRQEDQA